jgi:hypothetical protein
MTPKNAENLDNSIHLCFLAKLRGLSDFINGSELERFFRTVKSDGSAYLISKDLRKDVFKTELEKIS